MTGDVGIGKLLPQYDRELLTPADLAYWEVLYDDGTVLRETDAGTYNAIDRSRVASFRVVYAGEILIETFPPPGATGRHLVYRRRTTLGQSGGGRRVLFVFGWAPHGPAFALDVAAKTYRVLERGFDPADVELYPPVPISGEADYASAST